MSAAQLVFTPGAGKGMVHAGVDENLGVRSARQRAHNRLTRGRRAKLVVFRDLQHRVRGVSYPFWGGFLSDVGFWVWWLVRGQY